MTDQRIRVVVTGKKMLGRRICRFELQAWHGDLPPFTAGSHITVTAPNGMARTYSLTDPPGNGYAITVGREAGGRGGSRSLVDDTAVGDELLITKPIRGFVPADAPSHLLVAGGMGITGIRALRAALRSVEGCRVRTVYLARNRDEAPYAGELTSEDDLLHLSDEAGRLDLWPFLAVPDGTHLYCCGSQRLVEEVRALTMHWNPRTVHFENFTNADTAAPAGVPFTAQWYPGGRAIEVAGSETLLTALRRNGVDVPSSCLAGICGSCRLRLVEGEADHRDVVLAEHERASAIIPCVSRAATPRITVAPTRVESPSLSRGERAMNPDTMIVPAIDAQLTIDGESVTTPGRIEVVDPATGENFSSVPDAGPAQVDAALAAADKAFAGWRADENERRAALRRMAATISAAEDELARLLTAEQGKPLTAARMEVAGAAGWLNYYADLDLPAEVLRDDEQARVEVVRRPLGPVVAIPPNNFPLFIAFAKVASALRVGDTVVLKPSPYTPVTTLRIGELLREVLPPGVLNVISGSDAIGPLLTGHALTRVITFTGSTATGKRIAMSAMNDVKRLVLEMGGNDPAIVLDDADIDAIADRLFATAFDNNGQACVAPKRLYVASSLHDRLVDALVDRARAVRVGSGFDPATELGPLTTALQRDRVAELVADAVAHGASAIAGEQELGDRGFFHRPTILTGATDGMRVVDEEQFGPALPIIPFTQLEDAIRSANSGAYGLGSSVWGTDTDRARAVATRLEAGMTWVNNHVVLAFDVPFAGSKQSGVGVEGGPRGVEGYADLHVIHETRAS